MNIIIVSEVTTMITLLFSDKKWMYEFYEHANQNIVNADEFNELFINE